MIAALALKRRAAGVRIGIDGEALTLEADAAPPPTILAAEVQRINDLCSLSRIELLPQKVEDGFRDAQSVLGKLGRQLGGDQRRGLIHLPFVVGFCGGAQPS